MKLNSINSINYPMTKVVCRLLDANNNLIGWTEIKAAIPGDGTLRASEPVVIVVEQEGVPVCISHHWCDPNVEIRLPINASTFKVGEQHAMYNAEDELFRVGPMPQGLPAVTMRAAGVIPVPVGGFGIKT
jgi:hypothetical protein